MDISGPETVALAVLVAGGGTAAAVDLAQRRVPNALSLGTSIIGFTLAAAGMTGITIWSSLAGFALGLALMLPGHLLGATGAGDVKLFAAAGTVLGATRTVHAFVFVAIAGGVLAVAFACARGRLAQTLTRTAQLCGRPSATKAVIEAPAENNRFPYAPAIAAGCVLALLW